MSIFQLVTDKQNKTYFDVPLTPNLLRLPSGHQLPNLARFSNRDLSVAPLATTPFSGDLTASSDDVLLAFLSLLLLLAFESIVAALLLRATAPSPVSSFAYSVKLLLDLLRDLRLPRSLPARRALPPRLAVAAATLLTLVFGIEVLVLFLSEPYLAPVYNDRVTLRLLQPVSPFWNAVRFQNRASLDRPCSAMPLIGADQGHTRITACVSADFGGLPLELFKKLSRDDRNVSYQVETDVHRYGMQHNLSIGSLSASYSSRAYFSLGDEKARLMPVQGFRSPHEDQRMQHVHRQLIGFICSIYKLATKDKNLSLNYLNSLSITFSGRLQGPSIKVLRRPNGTFREENSTKYITTTEGRLPRGAKALRVAHHVFRASIGINVTDPDEYDLFLEEGTIRRERAVVWRESVRSLNWLSMCVMLGAIFVVLILMRFLLRPTSTANLAALFVKKAVGADLGRSPVQLAKGEKSQFRAHPRRGEFFRVGAEVEDDGARSSDEYAIQLSGTSENDGSHLSRSSREHSSSRPQPSGAPSHGFDAVP